MEKYKKVTSNYILSKLYKQGLFYFTTKTFSDFFEVSRTKAHQTIFSLKKRDLIREVERGKYLLLGFEPEKVLSNPFFIASQIIVPSYISFRSALNYYGLTEQVPFTIYLATTKRKKEVHFEGYRYKYVVLAPHKFFGYEKQLIGEFAALVAEKEKSLIDSLDQLKQAGGILEVSKTLFNAKDEIDNRLLLDYAIKMRNKTLCSRLGFLLEKYQMQTGGLKKHISTSFVSLDPDKPKTKVWDRRWRVNVNVSNEDLFSWGVS